MNSQHYYHYKPIVWNYVNNYQDKRGAMYKVQLVQEKRVIARRFVLPQLDKDYNIQLWIRETNNPQKTTELGIEQMNRQVTTFVYCSDTWHKDRYQNHLYIRSPTATPEQSSSNRITRFRILRQTNPVGVLQFELFPTSVKGFLNEEFFGELSCDMSNIYPIQYGIEVYNQNKPFEFLSQEIYRLLI